MTITPIAALSPNPANFYRTLIIFSETLTIYFFCGIMWLSADALKYVWMWFYHPTARIFQRKKSRLSKTENGQFKGISKNPFWGKADMHVICFVNLPRSATARLRKVSLQLPYLSAFSLIKRVFRDALNKFPYVPCNSFPDMDTQRNIHYCFYRF